MNNNKIFLNKADVRYANYLQNCAYYRWLSYRGTGRAMKELIQEAMEEGKKRGNKQAITELHKWFRQEFSDCPRDSIGFIMYKHIDRKFTELMP